MPTNTMKTNTQSDIILIGPVGVGKTTTAKRLSIRLQLPYICMDELRLDYYREMGYDDAHRIALQESIGPLAVKQYWEIFDAHAVERILADHQNCIFDFGGGTLACEYPFNFDRLQAALAPYPNVILLIPSPDKAESLRIIYERKNLNPPGWTLLKYFVMNEATYRLAKQTVYVKDKTPEEVCDTVLASINTNIETEALGDK